MNLELTKLEKSVLRMWISASFADDHILEDLERDVLASVYHRINEYSVRGVIALTTEQKMDELLLSLSDKERVVLAEKLNSKGSA